MIVPYVSMTWNLTGTPPATFYTSPFTCDEKLTCGLMTRQRKASIQKPSREAPHFIALTWGDASDLGVCGMAS